MLRTYIVWGLFIIVTIYLIKELFVNKKEDIGKEDEEIETEEDKELTEIALNAAPVDESGENKSGPDSSPEPDKKLIRVFNSSSQVQSRMIAMKLEESGIEAIIEPVGAGIFPLDSESSCDEAILVDEKDVASAQKIIMNHIEEEKKHSKQTQIISSGKDKNNSCASKSKKSKQKKKKSN